MLDNDEIAKIVQVLQSGGLIVFPTDTVWGLGCNALDESAIQKIYDLKKRDPEKSLLILVDNIERLRQYVQQIHPKAQNLLDYHTRPLTIVYDEAKNLPDNLIANNGSIAIRLVQDDFCKEIVRQLDAPIVATSANFSQRRTPTCFDQIDPEFLAQVDYVAQHRQEDTSERQPSVIVKIGQGGELIFLRK